MMLAFVLGTTVAFTSCSNDDEEGGNSSNSIVGTWYGYNNDSYTEDGKRYEYSSYNEFTFQQDGLVIAHYKVTEKLDGISEEYESTEYNAWKTDGNIIYMGPGYSKKDKVIAIDINDTDTWETKYNYSVSGKTLTLTAQPPYGTMTVTLTRK